MGPLSGGAVRIMTSPAPDCPRSRDPTRSRPTGPLPDTAGAAVPGKSALQQPGKTSAEVGTDALGEPTLTALIAACALAAASCHFGAGGTAASHVAPHEDCRPIGRLAPADTALDAARVPTPRNERLAQTDPTQLRWLSRLAFEHTDVPGYPTWIQREAGDAILDATQLTCEIEAAVNRIRVALARLMESPTLGDAEPAPLPIVVCAVESLLDIDTPSEFQIRPQFVRASTPMIVYLPSEGLLAIGVSLSAPTRMPTMRGSNLGAVARAVVRSVSRLPGRLGSQPGIGAPDWLLDGVARVSAESAAAMSTGSGERAAQPEVSWSGILAEWRHLVESEPAEQAHVRLVPLRELARCTDDEASYRVLGPKDPIVHNGRDRYVPITRCHTLVRRQGAAFVAFCLLPRKQPAYRLALSRLLSDPRYGAQPDGGAGGRTWSRAFELAFEPHALESVDREFAAFVSGELGGPKRVR